MPVFADVQLSTEAVVAIGALLAALSAAIYRLFQLVQKNSDRELDGVKKECARELSEEKSRSKSFQEIAAEAVQGLETASRKRNKERGVVHPEALAPVVPEHSSPTTEKQADAAELQTLRARLVAAKLQLELPAREAAPMAVKSEAPP